jgi:Zn-dependent protease with chaperone function
LSGSIGLNKEGSTFAEPSTISSAQAPLSPTKPRLNPFAFPSDTDFRLLLLVATVISSSLFTCNWIYLGLPQTRSDLEVYSQCQMAAQAAFPSDPATANQFYELCRAPVERRKGAWIVAGVGLILVLAIGLYLVAPQYKLRRRRLIALTPDDAPELIPALESLCLRAGLTSRPRFVWNPLNGAAVGLAFGRRGSYYVALTGGLVARFYSDRPAFDAVLLHELAHLRNGDVDKTYLALSLWQSFVVTGVIPLLGTIVLRPTLGAAADYARLLSWRILALAGLVYLARNAVLRSREAYADLRAAEWEGSGDALGRVLGGLPEARSSGLDRWLAALRVHPSRAIRQQALTDTRSLFRLGFWDALATGLAAGIAYPSLVTVILFFFTGVQMNLWYMTSGEVAGLIVATLLGLLAGGVIGLGVWRATLAAMIDGKRTISFVALAGGLTLGLGLGDWVAFAGGFQILPSDPQGLLTYGIAYLLVMALLAGGLFVVLRWFAGTSVEWLRLALGRESPPTWLPSYLMIGLVLSLWLTFTLQARNVVGILAEFGAQPGVYLFVAGGLMLQLLISPLVVLTVVCL